MDLHKLEMFDPFCRKRILWVSFIMNTAVHTRCKIASLQPAQITWQLRCFGHTHRQQPGEFIWMATAPDSPHQVWRKRRGGQINKKHHRLKEDVEQFMLNVINVETLHHCGMGACENIPHVLGVFEIVRQSMIQQVHARWEESGGNFENFLLCLGTTMAFWNTFKERFYNNIWPYFYKDKCIQSIKIYKSDLFKYSLAHT